MSVATEIVAPSACSEVWAWAVPCLHRTIQESMNLKSMTSLICPNDLLTSSRPTRTVMPVPLAVEIKEQNFALECSCRMETMVALLVNDLIRCGLVIFNFLLLASSRETITVSTHPNSCAPTAVASRAFSFRYLKLQLLPELRLHVWHLFTES